MITLLQRRRDSAEHPPYLSVFGLSRPPFAQEGGPAFFYPDPERVRCVDMLLHLTQYSEELLLVTGPGGIGKSALLEQLVHRSEGHWLLARVQGDRGVDAGDLFISIAARFGLEPGRIPPGELLGALTAHLKGRLDELPVIVVDDADRLSDDALEILLHLALVEGEHGRLVRLVLFGKPALETSLAGPRFAAIPPLHRMELRPLDPAQLPGYLNHRLRAAGFGGGSPFDDAAIKRLLKESLGNPRQLNLRAHHFLLGGVPKRARGGRRAAVVALAGVGGAVASMPLIALLSLHSPGPAAALAGGPPVQITCGSGMSALVGTMQSSAAGAMAPVLPAAAHEPVPNRGAASAIQLPDLAKSLRGSEGAKLLQEAVTPAATPPLQLASRRPLVLPAEEFAASGPTGPRPAPGDSRAEADRPLATPRVAGPPSSQRSDLPLLKGAEWIAKQPAGHFTLQLMAAGGVDSLDRFARASDLSGPLAAYRKGGAHREALHILIYGSYSSRAEAEAAAVAIARSGKVGQPWVRPLAAVQAEVGPEPEKTTPKGVVWIWTQEPSHYTIQLLAGPDPDALRRTAQRHRLEPAAVLPRHTADRLQYILISGTFADAAQARAALAALPGELAGSHPWIRSVGGLQEELANAASGH